MCLLLWLKTTLVLDNIFLEWNFFGLSYFNNGQSIKLLNNESLEAEEKRHFFVHF